MKFPQLLLAFYVIAVTGQGAFPQTNWGQVHPTIDPNIPSYAAQNSVSGKLTISVSEAMKPLVQAWADDLLLWHPALKVAVIVERSNTDLFPLLERQADVAAMSRRITRTEISNFILEYGHEPLEVLVAGTALVTFVHGLDTHRSARRSIYLYIAKPSKTVPTQASVELVQYGLSREGQQLALDLGHLPLSFEEVRQMTSRWSAALQ